MQRSWFRRSPSLFWGELAVALAAAPAFAQQSQPQPPQQQPEAPATQPEASLVGLPVYSNDGRTLGDVTEVGTFGGRRMLRAEMGTTLGPSPALIPADMFEHKTDRIEVAMTADEVRDMVAKQKQQR